MNSMKVSVGEWRSGPQSPARYWVMEQYDLIRKNPATKLVEVLLHTLLNTTPAYFLFVEKSILLVTPYTDGSQFCCEYESKKP